MIQRLRLLIEHYNLTASSFADKINVPRSSISHLLSGRNKPSLDFVMKIVEAFDEVDLNWIVYGKGIFPKNTDNLKVVKTETEPPSLFPEEFNIPPIKPKQDKEIEISKKYNNSNKSDEKQISNTINISTKKELIKVVLFYKDGSFEEYNK